MIAFWPRTICGAHFLRNSLHGWRWEETLSGVLNDVLVPNAALILVPGPTCDPNHANSVDLMEGM